MEQIICFFPLSLQEQIKKCNIQAVEEIRLRVGKPVILKNNKQELIIQYIPTSEVILQVLQKLCENSLYSYQNQICEGFLTLKGGHRVGITGNVVMKEEKVLNINYISSLNFRIARQILGCSNLALPYLIDISNNQIFTTLIISPPGCGKTTLLRDIIRRISNGIPEFNFQGVTCGVVDERGEIAASDKGIPQNDLGIRTDVLDNIPKALGMKLLIRSMSPKVIIADEIGSKADIEAIQDAITSGVKGIFTAHGASLEEIEKNPNLKVLLSQNKIERILLLDNKRIIHLIYENKNSNENRREYVTI